MQEVEVVPGEHPRVDAEGDGGGGGGGAGADESEDGVVQVEGVQCCHLIWGGVGFSVVVVVGVVVVVVLSRSVTVCCGSMWTSMSMSILRLGGSLNVSWSAN